MASGLYVGKQVAPEVGLRVELAGRSSGPGTVAAVHDNGLACSVVWDSGSRDATVIPTGASNKYALVSCTPQHSTQGIASSSTLPQQTMHPPPPPQPSYTQESMRDSQTTFVDASTIKHTSISGISAGVPGAGGNPWPSNAAPGLRYSQSSGMDGRGSWGRKRLQELDWLDRITGLDSGYTHHSSIGSIYSETAKISQARTTVGLSVYGTQVDYVVPGGPAQLSQQLHKRDEILAVDGRPVNQDNLTEAIVGSDIVNTTVRMRVRKGDSGRVCDVEVMRVSKKSMENMVRLFELLTVLKQNGHNNENFEIQMLRGEQDTTLVLVDKVVSLISLVQLEKYEADMKTRMQFQELYNEMRQHLTESYTEIDQLEKDKQRLATAPMQLQTFQPPPQKSDNEAQQLAILQREFEMLRVQLEKTTEQLELSKAESDSLRLTVSNMSSKQGGEREVASDQAERVRALLAEMDALRKDRNEAAHALNSARSRIAELEATLVRFRNDLEDARQALMDAQAMATICGGGDVCVQIGGVRYLPQSASGDLRVQVALDEQEQAKGTKSVPLSSPVFDEVLKFQVQPQHRTMVASLISGGSLLGQCRVRITGLVPFPSDTRTFPLNIGTGQAPLVDLSGNQTIITCTIVQTAPPPPYPDVRGELQATRGELSEARGELEAARQAINRLEALLEVLKDEREGLSDDLTRSTERLTMKIRQLEQAAALKDHMIKDLQDELLKLQKSRSTDLAALEQCRATDLSALEQECASWKQQSHEHEKALADALRLLKDRDADVGQLRKALENSPDPSVVEGLKSQAVRQSEMIKLLEIRIAEQEEWQHDIAMLQEKIRVLERAKGRVEEELTVARAAVDEARKVQKECEERRKECERLQGEIRILAQRLMEAEATLRNDTAAKDYEAEVLKLHAQVEQLQKQWQATREEEAEEHRKAVDKLQMRTHNLLMQLDAKDQKLANPTCGACGRGLVCPHCKRSEIVHITHREEVTTRAAPPPPLGVVGLKIENLPPHRVLSVTELMDEGGKIINDRVSIGDELVEIDGVDVGDLPVDKVVQTVSGPSGTLVTLGFSSSFSGQVYAVTALRHSPISGTAANAATLQVRLDKDYSKFYTTGQSTRSTERETYESYEVVQS